MYYALYPAWLALRRRGAALGFLVVPVMCFALAFLGSQPFVVTVLIYYPVWLAGAALAEALSRHEPIRVPLAVSGAVFAAGCALHTFGRSMILTAIAALLFGAASVSGFAGLSDRVVASPLGRLFEYLGERSYTIYIVHFPFVALLSAAVFQLQGARPMSGWLAMAGAVVAVVFGCLCFELCERHFVHHRVSVERTA